MMTIFRLSYLYKIWFTSTQLTTDLLFLPCNFKFNMLRWLTRSHKKNISCRHGVVFVISNLCPMFCFSHTAKRERMLFAYRQMCKYEMKWMKSEEKKDCSKIMNYWAKKNLRISELPVHQWWKKSVVSWAQGHLKSLKESHVDTGLETSILDVLFVLFLELTELIIYIKWSLATLITIFMA